MAIYYPNIVKIHDVMNDGGRLGEITQIMEDIGKWAKVQSERILTTPFLNPEHEEENIKELGEALLFIFDNFGIDSLRYRNGTSFRFGTVFDSDQQPVFTIYGAEFYTEEGERYKELSEVPMGVICSWWFNEYPHSFFIKMPHPRTGKPVVVPCDDVMPKIND